MPRKKGFLNYSRYINESKFVKIEPFSPTSASREILFFIFFPPDEANICPSGSVDRKIYRLSVALGLKCSEVSMDNVTYQF